MPRRHDDDPRCPADPPSAGRVGPRAAAPAMATMRVVTAAMTFSLLAASAHAQGLPAEPGPMGGATVAPSTFVSEAPQAPQAWDALDTTVRSSWANGPGPLQFRWGAQDIGSHGEVGRQVWGLGVNASARSTLYYEQGASVGHEDGVRSHRWGLEFRPSKSTVATLRDIGTFRVQLGSSEGRIRLRPRKGSLQVAWQSTF